MSRNAPDPFPGWWSTQAVPISGAECRDLLALLRSQDGVFPLLRGTLEKILARNLAEEWVCSACGSNDVQTTTMVHANAGTDEGGDGPNWCGECEEEVDLCLVTPGHEHGPDCRAHTGWKNGKQVSCCKAARIRRSKKDRR